MSDLRMWDCTRELIFGRRAMRYVPLRGGTPVPYRDVVQYWQDDEPFRSFFISLLASSKFAGYRWETPPVTAATADRPFEFVLLDAVGIERAPEPKAFAEQFRSAGGRQVVTFPNLGNDAVLVVPTALGPSAAYVHLAAFVRHAPAAQVHALWRAVGAAVGSRLSVKPVWVSTAGMGVAWLHVRLDDRPKYYGFAPYRDAP
jgi:hypothetical protein